jgi:zona occludens toxin (predicted ATPase)
MSKHKPQPEKDPKPPGETVTAPPAPPAPPGEDVNVRVIARFGIGLFVVAALVSAGIYLFVQTMAKYEAHDDPERPPMGSPHRAAIDPDNLGAKAIQPDGGIRLQRDPFGDIEAEKKQEREILDNYDWADEKAGVARIPIDRAMRLVVSRGLLVRNPGEAATGAPKAAPSPTVAPRPAATRTKIAARPKASSAPAPAASAAPAPSATEEQQ